MKTTPEAPFPELTPREHEILDLIAQGLTNGAIAEKLVLSPKTICNYLSNIFSKLQLPHAAKPLSKPVRRVLVIRMFRIAFC
jgi:DNA-binding NarL/FixJ family response regulator